MEEGNKKDEPEFKFQIGILMAVIAVIIAIPLVINFYPKKIKAGVRVICPDCTHCLKEDIKETTVLGLGKTDNIQIVNVLCDTCANKLVEVQTGEMAYCKGCQKLIYNHTKTIKVKKINAGKYIVIKPWKICEKCRLEEEERKRLKQRVDRLREDHPDWDEADCQLILKRKISMGMTREQVIASWGRPDHKNSSSVEVFDGSIINTEIWTYERGNYHYQYLTFKDGFLDSWSDSE